MTYPHNSLEEADILDDLDLAPEEQEVEQDCVDCD